MPPRAINRRRRRSNLQLPEESDVAKEVSALVVQALNANPMFVAAALPHTIFPPLFNRYEGGGEFGLHVDNAIRQARGGGAIRIRSDLSATLFLSEPEAYDGGELIIEEMYGSQAIKLPAGDLVLYPSKSLHRVTPVTRGARVSSFMWMQSLVRDDARSRDPVPPGHRHPARRRPRRGPRIRR